MESVPRTQLYGFGRDTTTPELPNSSPPNFFHRDELGRLVGIDQARATTPTAPPPPNIPDSELRSLRHRFPSDP